MGKVKMSSANGDIGALRFEAIIALSLQSVILEVAQLHIVLQSFQILNELEPAAYWPVSVDYSLGTGCQLARPSWRRTVTQKAWYGVWSYGAMAEIPAGRGIWRHYNE